MHTVVVAVATASQSFPAGTIAAGIKISMGTFSETVTVAPYSASFADVPAGDYTVTAQALDANGADLGAPVTAPVTVAPDAVQVDVPASISVTVS